MNSITKTLINTCTDKNIYPVSSHVKKTLQENLLSQVNKKWYDKSLHSTHYAVYLKDVFAT